MTDTPAVDVIQAECAERPAQQWVIENHWRHEDVMWQRLRPAHRLDLCLQHQSDETAGFRAVLRTCGPNWIQQWQLHPG